MVDGGRRGAEWDVVAPQRSVEGTRETETKERLCTTKSDKEK